MDITSDQLEGYLTRSCPSFVSSEQFREWNREWAGTAEPPYYLVASAFVRHLTGLNALKQYAEFANVFAMIEELHLHGDTYVNELATVGLLEDLQNANVHQEGSRPDDFVKYLCPVSKWWWEEVNLFWSGQGNIGTSGRPHPQEMGNSGKLIFEKT